MATAKRFTTVNSVDLTDYELGHQLWQSRQTLPADAGRQMTEGYRNAAKEYHGVLIADIQNAFRERRFRPFAQYWKDVEGIHPDDPHSLPVNPVTIGFKRSRPWCMARFFGESVR